jgi:SAM-dependent methyltransferase
MDVGAGYGRFASLFRRFYSQVILLEPAGRIYEKLVDLWGQDPRIECYNCDFESYIDKGNLDLVFTSGVLYLYDDKMLESFARKATSMLAEGGLFLIRDFISVPDRQVVQSDYVEGGFCYYRTSLFWDELATRLGVELLEIRRSKPSLSWLRNRYVLALFRKLNLKKNYRRQTVVGAAMRLGNFEVCRRGLQTVFIGMRRL